MIDINYLFLAMVLFLLFELSIIKPPFSSPSVIFTSSFLICSMCAMYLGFDWNIAEIHITTFQLIIMSNLIFFIIELIIKNVVSFFKKNELVPIRACKNERRPIVVADSLIFITIIISIVSICWSLMYIFQFIGGGNWNAIMAMYKDTINQNQYTLGIGRIFLNQINKVLVSLVYILLFIYNHNSSCKSVSPRQQKLYLLTFFLFCVHRLLLTGSRQSSLFFIVAWLTIWYICITTKQEKKIDYFSDANINFIKRMVTVTALIFPLFYFIGRLVGRKLTDILYAPTSYLATGIYGLNWEIAYRYSSTYFGEMSFPGMYWLFKLIDVIPENIKPQSFLPFFYHGNTVSILGRWYWDFGFYGALVLTAVTALFFCYIYYFKLRHGSGLHKRNIWIIIYSYCIHVLFFAGYDDFVMNILSLNFFLTVGILCLFYKWFVWEKISLKFRYK